MTEEYDFNPNKDFDYQPVNKGYQERDGNGGLVSDLEFNPKTKSLLSMFLSWLLIGLLLLLVALYLGWSDYGYWESRAVFLLATKHNISIDGKLPGIYTQDTSLPAGRTQVSRILFSNDALHNRSPLVEMSASNEASNGFRKQNDGIYRLRTYMNGSPNDYTFEIDQFGNVSLGEDNITTTVVGPLRIDSRSVDFGVEGETGSHPLFRGMTRDADNSVGPNITLGDDSLLEKISYSSSIEHIFNVGGNEVFSVDSTGTNTNGVAVSTGGFVQISDQRIKVNVENIDIARALDNILLISTVEYEISAQYADALGVDSNERKMGVLAQQVASNLPQAVTTVPGFPEPSPLAPLGPIHTIRWDVIVTQLVASVQELERRVSILEETCTPPPP